MIDQIWALLDAKDYCVGEYIGEEKPTRRSTSTKFKRAVRVERRGDMMVEDIIVDHEAGTGRWVTHEPSRQRSDLLARLNAMDRVQFLEFVLSEAGHVAAGDD